MSAFISEINRQAGRSNHSFCEYATDRLEVSIENTNLLMRLLSSRNPSTTPSDAVVAEQYLVLLGELLSCLRALHVEWQDYLDGRQEISMQSYSAPLIYTTSRGRPKFEVNREQILYLLSMSFSWKQIASILGVSYMTIYRRRQEYGIPSRGGRAISDIQLREHLHQLQQDLPSLGQTLVWGRIRSMGFRVSRNRIREIMRATDPINTALRWRGEVVQRQPYSVPAPNSLWHIGKATNFLGPIKAEI